MRDIALTDALRACAELRVRTEAELVDIRDAPGRTLAVDVRALSAVPQADRSALDGVALRSADTPGWLHVVGEHRAGAPATAFVGEGQAVTVSAGALMPAGADAVVPAEHTGRHGELVEVSREAERGQGVRRAGEIIMEGVLMLPAGMVVPATAVTGIGTVGHARIPVWRRPRVAVLGVGDELVALGTRPRPWQTPDAGRIGVAAQVAAAGGVVVYDTHVGDDPDATVNAVRDALAGDAELLVTVGGVSGGADDHVRDATERAGVRAVFHGLAVRPCRATRLGERDGRAVLCLPGDPASAAIAFHLLGRALLGRPAGWEHRAPLGATVHGEPGELSAVRCIARGGRLHPLPTQAPDAFTTMAVADSLALVEGVVHAGDLVPWTPLD